MIPSSSKIVLAEGDVAEPDLGLGPGEFNKLGERIDAIIHCAANRSFWDAHQVTRLTNVRSVRTLACLTAVHGSVLHVLSSGAVDKYGEDANNRCPPTDGSDGYVASKWAAEQYLRKAFAEVGLSSTIHRPTVSAGGSSTKQVQEAAQSLLEFAAKLGKQPDSAQVRGTVDLAPAADIADKVTAAVLADASSHRLPGVRVIHHPGQLRATTEDLAKCVAETEHLPNLALPKLPLLEWFGEAKKQGFHSLSLRSSSRPLTII